MKIPKKRILQQLKEDLTGKDSHSGITLSYAWLANQYGHISLGFIPCFLLYHFFHFNSYKCALYISLAWLVFEIYNIITSFFNEKKSSLKFKSAWKNVVFDTFTDVCFFALGAFLFSLTITKGSHKVVNITLVALAIYLFFASKYWFTTKMYQFYAYFPFQFRLSQWNFNITEQDKDKVFTFLSSKKNEGNHLLVYGDFGSGKTSLGVGILNELSIKNNSCLYKNGSKMFSAFFDGDFLQENEIWNWRTTDFLMIDNINPSKPVKNQLVSPEKLLSYIDTLQPIHQENRKTIKEKNVIWILGNKPVNNTSSWEDMLLKIGVSKHKILSINLSD